MRSFLLIALLGGVSIPTMAAADAAETADAVVPPSQTDEEDDTPEVGADEIVVIAPQEEGLVEVPNQPIQTFDETDIAAYGADSIADLIDAISPQTGSGRGRGSGRPVILVNGQRISSFREMRDIPPEAIKRMEVLPEEVALRFGYPANQRVVNLVMKDHFAAAKGAGEYNRPTRGGYDNYEMESGLFKIAGPRRYNVSAKLTETSMLTEDERGIRLDESDLPSVSGDPDPARYRSLASADSELELNGTMTQGIGEGGLDGQITLNGAYTHQQTTSLSGLDAVTLTSPDGSRAIRSLPDPLTTRAVTDTFEGGFNYTTTIGGWTLSATGDGAYTDTETRVDRRRDTSGLVEAARAGTLAVDGALPFVPGAGVDVARSRDLSLTTLTTLSGRPFRVPAGDANLTIKAGYQFERTAGDDTRTTRDAATLRRGDLSGGVNLAVPLTGRDFLGAVGEMTFNVGGGFDRLSDFGTLKNWNVGLTWNPTDALSFQASYLVEDAAPTLAQLGAPTILSYNVPVYDFTAGQTALVTVTTGGNRDLVKERQRDIKLSATWKLPFLDRSNMIVEYFRNRSSDVTQTFPLLTPAIEAAFPGRVTRDEEGNLIAIDRRAVTYDQVSTSSIRWGFNLSGRLGGDGGGSERGGDRPARAAAPSPSAQSAPQAAGAPGGAFAGGSGARPGFDPTRFEALRKSLCAPAQDGATPDLSSLPEGMRGRLVGPDGKIDPDRLARTKERICSGNGPGGRFDPEAFARMRAALCAGNGSPDLSSVPEPMLERLRGPDGQIDQSRLAATRERMCSSDRAPPEAAGAPPPPDAPAGGMMRFGGGEGRMGGSGFGPPRGGRWNLSIYHTWRFLDEVRIAPGVPVLDELAGDAIAAGGVPRHTIEMEGGLFRNGYGLRLKGEWNAPAKVNGSGLPGSSDLRFGSTFVVDARLFADLGRMEDLVARAPFFKGARLALTVDNTFDSRQRVTDENGEVPLAYQAAYREPQGRVIGIDFRKMF